MRPRESYKGRIYSTNVVGWEGVKHIGKRENGEKDFSEIIQQTIELGGYPEDQEPHEILVGFGHHSVLSDSDKIVAAVKAGKIRHFFLIGGCDGARPGRNYYTEFATLTVFKHFTLSLWWPRIINRDKRGGNTLTQWISANNTLKCHQSYFIISQMAAIIQRFIGSLNNDTLDNGYILFT